MSERFEMKECSGCGSMGQHLCETCAKQNAEADNRLYRMITIGIFSVISLIVLCTTVYEVVDRIVPVHSWATTLVK